MDGRKREEYDEGKHCRCDTSVHLCWLACISVLTLLCYKIFLAAIVDFLPSRMIVAIREFLDFCYLIQREVIDEDSLCEIDGCLKRYHIYQESFRAAGVLGKRGFSKPRQHSLVHYRWLIQQFGAPSGLSTSITESKHKESVKDVWKRSNRNEAIYQMMKMVQRNDKMKAQRTLFEHAGMLPADLKDGNLQGRSPTPSASAARLSAGSVHVLENDDVNDDGYNEGPTDNDDDGAVFYCARVLGSHGETHASGATRTGRHARDESSTAIVPKSSGMYSAFVLVLD